MISCGIDVGARTVKAVLMENGRILAKTIRSFLETLGLQKGPAR